MILAYVMTGDNIAGVLLTFGKECAQIMSEKSLKTSPCAHIT